MTGEAKPIGVLLQQRGGLGTAVQTVFLFASVQGANAAYRKLVGAMEAYEERANDRRKFVEIKTATGSSTVDITEIINVSVDTGMCGVGRPYAEAWQRAAADLGTAQKEDTA